MKKRLLKMQQKAKQDRQAIRIDSRKQEDKIDSKPAKDSFEMLFRLNREYLASNKKVEQIASQLSNQNPQKNSEQQSIQVLNESSEIKLIHLAPPELSIRKQKKITLKGINMKSTFDHQTIIKFKQDYQAEKMRKKMLRQKRKRELNSEKSINNLTEKSVASALLADDFIDCIDTKTQKTTLQVFKRNNTTHKQQKHQKSKNKHRSRKKNEGQIGKIQDKASNLVFNMIQEYFT